MSRTIKAVLVPVSKTQFYGHLTTSDGIDKYTEKGTKAEVLQSFAKMPEYQQKPALINLQ